MDVAVVWLMERRRPAGQQSAAAMDHNRGQIVAAVGEAAGQLQALEGELTLGHIALACALGYLEFRHPDFAWREHADARLIDWYAGFGERSSLRETAHPA
jgi:glutathione S-transferase